MAKKSKEFESIEFSSLYEKYKKNTKNQKQMYDEVVKIMLLYFEGKGIVNTKSMDTQTLDSYFKKVRSKFNATDREWNIRVRIVRYYLGLVNAPDEVYERTRKYEY
ncbi:MAG: hypothetical protein HRT57_02350 [Crocinitomicaceae bacterium]|nr:hypothetical protein [Crocinitomicaceae bacterium]